LAALSCVVLVGLSVAFVDRPAATWAHRVLHRAPVFVWLTFIVVPLPPLAVLGTAGAALASFAGWRPEPRTRIVIACCVATILAIVAKQALKLAFGQTWPETWVHGNPSWIQNGVYGFFPFHGGKGWASFPSGHTSVVSAPCAVLWQRVRRLRVLWAIPVLLVAIGLFGADFHFVSDIVAGIYVGAACAAATLAALRARGEVREPAETR
jgi:membrane-associated phospholipid phosphatase